VLFVINHAFKNTWRKGEEKMTYHQVSEENISKVESFFVQKAKETGSKKVEVTVIEIAEGADVALATAHKAIQQLERDKIIEVIKPKSRRFPITYIYKRDIEGFEVEQSQQWQLEYLFKLVKQQSEEIADLKKRLNEVLGEKRMLENRLYNRG
jgi:predicted transcriptional regulator